MDGVWWEEVEEPEALADLARGAFWEAGVVREVESVEGVAVRSPVRAGDLCGKEEGGAEE